MTKEEEMLAILLKTKDGMSVSALTNVLDIWDAYGIDVAMEHFNSLKRDEKCCCLYCL